MDLLKVIVVVGLGLFEVLAVAIGLVNIPKKKKADLIAKKEFVCTHLPSIINYAEKSSIQGKDKKEFAISVSLATLEKRFGVLQQADQITMTQYISDVVEQILSTPQKKGD